MQSDGKFKSKRLLEECLLPNRSVVIQVSGVRCGPSTHWKKPGVIGAFLGVVFSDAAYARLWH